AFVRAPPGDGFLEPWAHAGRHHGDPRLARYCVRGNRPVINPSGPIRDESLTPNRVTTPEDMAEFRSAADMVVRAGGALAQSPLREKGPAGFGGAGTLTRQAVGRARFAPRAPRALRAADDNAPVALPPCDSASRASTVGIVRG